MMNYHELTMNEPRDSPARRKQFLVISTVMVFCFFYASVNAGLFTSLVVTEGTFPGGEFVYKSAKRDYAAAPSLERQVADDLDLKLNAMSDVIYTIYLDNPNKISGGRNHRFASGVLANTANSDRTSEGTATLLARNDRIVPPTRAEVLDLPASDLWQRLRYKTTSLPSARAAVVYFPYTNGFVSGLIHSHKIIPQLRAYAAEQHRIRFPTVSTPVITVITTCSINDGMCTHFAPLEPTEPFLLGQPTMEVYMETLRKEGLIDFDLLKRRFTMGLQKVSTFFGGKSQIEEVTETTTAATTAQDSTSATTEEAKSEL